jgi:hypothetical protein
MSFNHWHASCLFGLTHSSERTFFDLFGSNHGSSALYVVNACAIFGDELAAYASLRMKMRYGRCARVATIAA